MKQKDKALLTIEGILLSAQSENKRELQLFKFAHIGADHCKNKHERWVKELNDTYNLLKERKVI